MLRQCVNLLRQCQRFWRRRIFEWLVLFILFLNGSAGGEPECSQCALTSSLVASVSILSGFGIERPVSHLCVLWTEIPVSVSEAVWCRKLKSRAKSVAPFTSVELRLSANFNLSANSAFAWSDGIAKILLCPSADAFIQMIDIYRISFTMIPIRSMSGLFSTCSKNEHG